MKVVRIFMLGALFIIIGLGVQMIQYQEQIDKHQEEIKKYKEEMVIRNFEIKELQDTLDKIKELKGDGK